MKIAVLVSGGVDSSVALKLLQEQGHEVTAFYLKIWLQDELSFLGTCPWEEDLSYVRSLCEQLAVPLTVVSMQDEYWEHVVSYTIAEVKAGRTPNPDIFCNKLIKFGMFIRYLESTEQFFDKVASGHYAQVREQRGMYELIMSPDPIKDQTYFLAHLSQEQLARVMFPIGHLPKEKVRELAHAYHLPTMDRKDSQGICFLGKIKFNEFIKQYVGTKQGNLVEHETGAVMGTHEGFWYYTIGQRHGIGLAGGPWYVVAKDPDQNIVHISRKYYADDKKRNTFSVTTCNWLALPVPGALQVKMRHGPHKHECTIEKAGEHSWRVTLNDRDQGIAPGQFAVFYAGDRCLGCGTITLEGENVTHF